MAIKNKRQTFTQTTYKVKLTLSIDLSIKTKLLEGIVGENPSNLLFDKDFFKKKNSKKNKLDFIRITNVCSSKDY